MFDVRELHEVDSGNTKIMNFSYLLHVFIVHCAKSPSASRPLVQRARVDDFHYILVGVLRRSQHTAVCMQHRTTGVQELSRGLLCLSYMLICAAAPQLMLQKRKVFMELHRGESMFRDSGGVRKRGEGDVFFTFRWSEMVDFISFT